jgi:O-antigen/teichoic acid export membrane protein
VSTYHEGAGIGDPGDPEGPAPPDRLSGSELQRRAVGGSLWTAIHTVSSVPLAFLANAVVARILGVADYGSLAFLTVGFAIATQIANAGFSASLIQWGAIAEVGGDRQRTDEFLRRSLGFHLAIELPILVMAVLLLARGQSWTVVGALVLSSLLTCLFGGASLALTIENRSASAAKLAIVVNVGVQLAGLLGAIVVATPMAVFVARLIAAAVAVPLQLLFLDPRRRRAVLQIRLPRKMPSGFWRFAVQSSVAGLLSALVFSRSEIFLLSWLSTPDAVGLFALAYGLSYQLTAPVDAMLNPLLPAVAGVISAHPHLAERAFLRATRFAALLTAMITGVLLPAAYFGMPLIYGKDFAPAAVLLIPLALISCLQSISQPVTAFVNARQQGGRLLRSNAFALAANLALALTLIKPLGIWGAVVANAAGQAVAVMVLARYELRSQGLPLSSFLGAIKIWPISCLAGLAAIGLVAQSPDLGTSPWLGIVAGPVVGALLLTLAARIAGAGLFVEDRAPLLEAVPTRLRGLFAVLTKQFVIRESRRGPAQSHASGDNEEDP